MVPGDVADFSYREDEIGVYDFFRNGAIGAKKYLLKENSDLEKDRQHLRKMLIVAYIASFLWYSALVWLVFFKLDIVSFLANKYNDVILYFTTD